MTATAQKIVNRPAVPVVARQPVQVRSTPGIAQFASALKISSPSDPAEREAEHTAKRVMRMPLPQSASTIAARSSPHAARFANTIRQSESLRIARKQEGTATASSSMASEINASQSSGNPLPTGIRKFMGPRFNADFSQVRIHTGEKAAQLNRQVGAQAFTVGKQIFFGRDRFRPDSNDGRELIAHELTHTIQQGTVVQRKEATDTNRVNQPAIVAGAGGPMIQRDAWWRRAGRAIGSAVSSVVEFGENIGWQMLEEFAPELVPIIRQGPLEWIKEKITSAVQSVFNNLMEPVRSVTGIAASLVGHFTNLVAWIRHAAARIANGDCGAVTEAAEKIQQVFEGLAAPVIDRIKHLADRVKSFFSGIWDRFGAPVWQFLQKIGGQAWEKIQQLGTWIWEKTAPIRRLLDRAWTWVKNKLGIGEGAEGQDGILQWVQRKAQSIWDEYVKPFYERYRKQILIVTGVLVMLSPAGPVIAIGAAIGGLAAGIRWIRQNLKNREAIIQQRGIFQGVIIPGILGAVNRVSAFLMEKAQFITGKLTQVVGGLNQALGTIAGSILGFAVSILQWIVDRFRELVAWAIQGLTGLANGVAGVLNRLSVYLQPILNVLGEIARVVGNVMRLPMLLAGRLWNMIPACIRNPFINFFIPLILRQIAFFRELAATPEAWQQTKVQVMELIQQVFHNFDLLGAIRTAFRIVVRALRIPVDLMVQLLDKAANAWDAVIAAPLRFIETAIKAILKGMGLFMRNILSNLWFGVQGWLLNAVSQSGVAPPASWTPRAIFVFVLDILGISVDHVIDLIDRRVPGAGRPLRTAVRLLTGAVEWIRIAITEGPRGLWNHLVNSLSNLGTMVLESAVGWIMTRVVAIVGARIAALAASAGLSGVLEAVKAIYNAIQTAIEYMPRILGILIRAFDTVTQLAKGAVEPAATMVAEGMRMAMPVVIGFLANYAGLGGIGGRIREIILDIRERVDNAILGLIDGAIAAIRSIYAMIQRGVQAVTQWWAKRRSFTAADNKNHDIYFQGGEASARLILASDEPGPIAQRLMAAKRKNDSKPNNDRTRIDSSRFTTAIDKANELESWLRTQSAPQRINTIFDTQLDEKLNQLQNLIQPLPVDDNTIPLTNVTFMTNQGRAYIVKAEPLTKNAGNTQGSSPQDSPVGWEIVERVFNRGQDLTQPPTSQGRPRRIIDWERVHLLSERLHGPGVRWNLTPTNHTANGLMSTLENRVYGEITSSSDPKTYKLYGTQVNYGHPDREYETQGIRWNTKNYPTSISVMIQGPDDNAPRTIPIADGLPAPEPDNAPPQRNTQQEKVQQINLYFATTPKEQRLSWRDFSSRLNMSRDVPDAAERSRINEYLKNYYNINKGL